MQQVGLGTRRADSATAQARRTGDAAVRAGRLPDGKENVHEAIEAKVATLRVAHHVSWNEGGEVARDQRYFLTAKGSFERAALSTSANRRFHLGLDSVMSIDKPLSVDTSAPVTRPGSAKPYVPPVASEEVERQRERLRVLVARREEARAALAARREKREASDVRAGPRPSSSSRRVGLGARAGLPDARGRCEASAVPCVAMPFSDARGPALGLRNPRPHSAQPPPSLRAFPRRHNRPTSALSEVVEAIGCEYEEGLTGGYAAEQRRAGPMPAEERSSLLSTARGHPGHAHGWNANAQPKTWDYWHKHAKGSFGRALMQLPEGSVQRQRLKGLLEREAGRGALVGHQVRNRRNEGAARARRAALSRSASRSALAWRRAAREALERRTERVVQSTSAFPRANGFASHGPLGRKGHGAGAGAARPSSCPAGNYRAVSRGGRVEEKPMGAPVPTPALMARRMSASAIPDLLGACAPRQSASSPRGPGKLDAVSAADIAEAAKVLTQARLGSVGGRTSARGLPRSARPTAPRSAKVEKEADELEVRRRRPSTALPQHLYRQAAERVAAERRVPVGPVHAPQRSWSAAAEVHSPRRVQNSPAELTPEESKAFDELDEGLIIDDDEDAEAAIVEAAIEKEVELYTHRCSQGRAGTHRGAAAALQPQTRPQRPGSALGFGNLAHRTPPSAERARGLAGTIRAASGPAPAVPALELDGAEISVTAAAAAAVSKAFASQPLRLPPQWRAAPPPLLDSSDSDEG